MRSILFTVLALFSTGVAAQEPVRDQPAETRSAEGHTPSTAPGQDPLPALEGLVETLRARRAELAELRAKSPNSPEVRALETRIARLQADFDSLVTGLDRAQIEQDTPKRSLSDEILDLLRPILEELKSATAQPRRLERLRSELAAHEHRQRMAATAIANIRRLQERVTDNPALAEELQKAYLEWQTIQREAINGQRVIRAQLDQHERSRKPLVDSAQELIARFFRSKGRNLLLAVLAFLAVFFGTRFVANKVVQAIAPRRGDGETPFYYRLLNILFQFAVIVAATLAALAVLYVAGDWVLLGLALMFLFGLAWATKNTLPRMVDEIRLLLNLGPVRESERVVFEGLPWRVDRLSLYTRLSNPALSGGSIRLPVRDLAGLHSRPVHAREAWFPCAEGDWVRLSDGTRAKVLTQTPEMVQLVKLGGSRVSYRTSDFLGMSPDNLSANFRLPVTFGVDYRHQAICTTEIPSIMRERIHRALVDTVGENKLINLAVEFKEAGASSLDYEVIADLHGDLAPRLEMLRRLIQRVLVDTCNEQGWVIPFTQITVHQAEAPGE